MKRVGFYIFLIGLCVASGFAARAVPVEQPSGADGKATPGDRVQAWGKKAGVPFGVGMVLMIAGGLVARRRPVLATTDGESPENPLQGEGGPEAVLERIVAILEGLPTGDLEAQAESVKDQLDQVLEVEVPAFLDLREALIADMGLEHFARMIGDFATLERNTGRAWSALTDEAYAEVESCLGRAQQAATRARGHFSDGAEV